MKYKIIFTVTRPDETVLYWATAFPEKATELLSEINSNGLMFAHYNNALTASSAEDVCYFVDENQSNTYMSWRATNSIMLERDSYDTEHNTIRVITFSGYVEDTDIPVYATYNT